MTTTDSKNETSETDAVDGRAVVQSPTDSDRAEETISKSSVAIDVLEKLRDELLSVADSNMKQGNVSIALHHAKRAETLSRSAEIISYEHTA